MIRVKDFDASHVMLQLGSYTVSTDTNWFWWKSFSRNKLIGLQGTGTRVIDNECVERNPSNNHPITGVLPPNNAQTLKFVALVKFCLLHVLWYRN